MANLESPEEKDFKDIVCDIRSASNYSGAIHNVKEELKLPGSITDYEIEALLIHATREQFGESLDADMVLMALGLLKGFDNPRNTLENRNCVELVTARRKMFIKMSSYVADRHNHNNKRRKRHYESYEELEAAGKDAIDAVVSALGSEDAVRIQKVAKKIFAKRFSIVDYLKEANKYLIYDKKGNIIDVKLQDLKSIRQKPQNTTSADLGESKITKFEPQEDDCIEISDPKVDDNIIQHPDEPKRTENDNPENPSPEPPSPPKPTGNDSIAFMIRAVSIALVIAVTALAFVAITRNSEREKEITAALVDKDRIIPNKITIINKNIEIPLGGNDYLTIKTEPLELNQNDLFYLCVNLDIAHMENIHSGHVIAATQIPNNVEWETDILVHDLDGTTQDTAHVYVTKTGNNDSLSPKGSNKKTDSTGARQ